MINSLPSPGIIKAVMRGKGYAVFGNEAKGYDLNLFGIRTNDQQANTFNDVVGVMYLENGTWCCFMFQATTDPGVYWREHPMNRDGTAILVPGQYRGAYKVGKHKGYPALQQKSPLKVYRDDDMDEILDMDPDTIQKGMYGINIHRANSKTASSQVNKWSAGCQVLSDPLHFNFLMALAEKSASIHGNSFTYTLLEEEDFSA
jgi:hypothetical protein